MDRRDALRLIGLSALAPLGGSLASRRAGQPAAQGAVTPDVELELSADPGELSLRHGPATRVWRFTGRVLRGPADTLQPIPGSYLGPTIRLRRGATVRVRFVNRLAEPSIVHWHGLDVPADADGHPRLAVDPGATYVYDFTVTNRAGTYWYHPHPHERTGPQVYMGLAGMLLVEDDEERSLGLPAGRSEVTCVLQDREFDGSNQFRYPDGGQAGGGMRMGMGRGGMGGMAAMMALENGVLGDRVVVNGRPAEDVVVEAGWVRLRILNGSNARTYLLGWQDGRPMTVIGTDGGLLERALERRALTLAPGQRADVLLNLTDLADDTTVRLTSLSFPAEEAGHVEMMRSTSPLPQGAPLDLLTLRVRGRNTRQVRLPDRLSAFGTARQAAPAAPVRRVPLSFAMMQWMIDGRVFGMEDVAPEETVRAGGTQVWEFINTTNPMGMQMAHPIHLHGRQFRVVGRDRGASTSALRPAIVDDGWTDTVLVLPGERVRAQVTFSDYPGLFLYHCHVLEHEDMGMMRNFRIV